MSRELDALVAGRVMGWSLSQKFKDNPKESQVWDDKCDGSGYRPCALWRPTTDPAADYEVLKHVREKWDDAKRTQFCAVMRDIWADRASADGWRNSYQQFYKPGDYSMAALKALGLNVDSEVQTNC